jgi:hypothetical protein
VLVNSLGYKNLPPSHNVRHRNTAIRLPLLQRLLALDKDAELLVASAALVEDLGLGRVAASHDC